MVRLLCIPLFLWLLFGAHEQTAAAILLAVLGATDWVDGYVARRFGQVSTLGKVLDPAADRLLVGTAVISIMVYGAVPLWFGIATIAREVLVSVMVLPLASLGAARIDVLWVGKAGTFGLMFAYPTFLSRLRRRVVARADQGHRAGSPASSAWRWRGMPRGATSAPPGRRCATAGRRGGAGRRADR